MEIIRVNTKYMELLFFTMESNLKCNYLIKTSKHKVNNDAQDQTKMQKLSFDTRNNSNKGLW